MPDTRLIERWLPIAEIGVESTRERTPMTPFPAPNRLHVWWARRPLVASRAAVLASLLPEDADRNRFLRVLGIHGDPLATRRKIDAARRKGERFEGQAYSYPRAFSYVPDDADRRWLAGALGRACGDFTVVDPTAGGGSIPFEALRLHVAAFANDLNPVAALLMRATIDWPARYGSGVHRAFEELAARFVEARDRRLAPYFPPEPGERAIPTNFLWARTVTCPYCDGLVPLSPNWRLAPGGTGVRLLPDCAGGPGTPGRVCAFEIVGAEGNQFPGTVARGDGHCPYADCGRVIDGAEIKRQAQAGRMGEQLFAVVYKRRVETRTKSGKRGRDKWKRGYRAPRPEDDDGAAIRAALDEKLVEWDAFDFVPNERYDDMYCDRSKIYGVNKWRDLFSPRQLLCHGTSVEVFRELLDADREAGRLDEVRQAAYGYLALALSKMTDWNSRLCTWHPTREVIGHTFQRHDFAFVWQYAEMAPLVTGVGYDWAIRNAAKCIRELVALVRPDADAGRSGQPGLFNQSGRPGRSDSSGDGPNRGEQSRGRAGGGRAETADLFDRPAAGNDRPDPPGADGGPPAVAGRPDPPAVAGRRPDPGDADPSASRAAPAAPPPVTITCKSGDSLDHLDDGSVDAVVMDPPYYDNVMYAELSDFFYVWLKRTAGRVFPELFRRRLTTRTPRRSPIPPASGARRRPRAEEKQRRRSAAPERGRGPGATTRSGWRPSSPSADAC